MKPLAWIALLAPTLLAGCLTGEDDAGPSPYHPVASFGDVHGLAVNPERPSELYVATHHGLVRGVDDANWSRVGDARHDLMGFSAHPTDGDVFWASGHPQTGGNLGVVKSEDGGVTWRQVGAAGKDFHAMAVSGADPAYLWGHAAGVLHRSKDGGVTWERVTDAPPHVLSLAADPWNRETLYLAGSQGVWWSGDGGETWRPLTREPALAVAVNPRNARELLVSEHAGDRPALWKVTRNATHEGSFERALLPLHGFAPPLSSLAYSPADPFVIYAATYRGAIYKSANGGFAWSEVRVADG